MKIIRGLDFCKANMQIFGNCFIDTFTFKSSTLEFIVIRRFSAIVEMLLLLRLQLLAAVAALLIPFAFNGVKAAGSEMYYRAVVHDIPKGTWRHPGHYQFDVEYCWRRNPTKKEECLVNGGNGEIGNLIKVNEHGVT